MVRVVIQANLQRSGLATDCLVRDIGVRHHPVIALIQEPYLGKQGKPLRIPAAFECYYGESNPRAAIIAHKSNLLLCPSYTSRDVTTCQITLETGEVAYLVSVYCDILVSELPKELLALLREQQSANIVLCMDSNAHSTLWGCQEPNSRGEMMEEFIMTNNLVVCNRGTEPTFATRRASSIIDITLCSSSLFNKIMDWRVNKGPYYSDHNRILFSLSTETTPTERSWVLKSADWGRFRDLMRQSSQKLKQPEYWTPDTVECATAQFYRDIEFSLSKVSPRIRAGRRYTNKWWNDNLTKLRRETRNLQKRAMASRDDESLWTRYKRSRNSLVAAIRKAKRDTWRSFTEEASSPESMIKLTKALFKKGG